MPNAYFKQQGPAITPPNDPKFSGENRLSIIHTEWSDGWGGQEHRIISELSGMLARGHRMLLVTRPSAKIGAVAKDRGIPVTFLPFRNKADFQTVVQLMRLVKEDGYQIIHTHSSLDTWVGAIAAKLSGAYFVRTRHLNLPMKSRWYNVHGHYDRLITCGNTMKSLLIDEYGFNRDRVVSIPTGIDFNRFVPQRHRADIRSELALSDNSFVILMAGVVRSVKRYDVALRAFAKTLEDIPDAHLVIAGNGPLLEKMIALSEHLGIRSSVHWLGHRQDVADLMIAADAVLLTSRSEGIPQVISQALGLERPCVATSVGGVPEIILHNETGLLVAPGSEAEISSALLKIAHNREWASTLGERGGQFIRQNLNLSLMLDKTEQLYWEMMHID